MNDKRKTLQKTLRIGVVSALAPNSWIKPIVNSVVLPAHAQTSMCSVTNLVGRWLYEGTTGNGINLHADGRSDAGLGGGRWSVDGTHNGHSI